ncbi:MAG: hypothetical protein OEY67_08325, partial [Gammaproteobacteria bacterium]|nr:hypothetical protein [Gammaproteobacteria bacterium]
NNVTDVKVTFRTLSCDGKTGFASVNADYVHRISQIDCKPGDPVRHVFQVMVKQGPGKAASEIFTVTEAEAEALSRKIEAYQEDKRKALRESDRIILERK